MHDILRTLALGGIVPVVVIEDQEQAVALAEALLRGGVATMEVTFRTRAARKSLERIAQRVPSMLLGAGTVLSVEQVGQALDAGAKYIVSPGLNPKVVDFCQANGVPVTPGVATPTEIETAIDLGLDIVKFFPAEAAGGLPYLKAMSAPYGQVRFIPTGGINESNLLAYLKTPSVLACGGSWIVNSELINSGKFTEVTRLTRQAIATILGLTLHRNDAPAPSAADERLFRALDAANTAFAPPRPGKSGTQYVTIGTHFPERAIAHFARHGIGVREELKDGKTGHLTGALLDITLDGFEVKLEQR
jgi:2-dehydro-3-deoxyphosphogluconate aldolase/(4S)-4-hydroxy-2-oxoglutarate aldolase